ncbi:sodium:solute symporter family protein [bacterium LRH843]|nr:sodium:solute symporter family protein [bacterium LRH843]
MSVTAIIVTAYFAIMIGWGAYFFIKNKRSGSITLEGQFVGTRSYSASYLLASLIAVWGSNNTLLAAAQSGYESGISGVIWYSAGIIIPLLLFTWPLNIPTRIREFFPKGLTIGDVIGERYDEKSRIVALVILFTSNILFIISIVLATGIILKSLLGISLSAAIIIGGIVMIAYTALGGLESLMYGHVFQLLLAGTAVVVAISISVAEFSLSELIHQISINSDEMLNVVAWGPSTMLSFFIANVGFIFAAPILYQLAFAGKNNKEVTLAFRLFPILWAPFAVGTSIMGMIAFLLYPNIMGQDAAMTLVANIFPEWAAILFFLGGLALVFSTADATLNNLASLVIFDIYKKFSKTEITSKKASTISMTTIVLLGVIGIVGALNFGDGVLALLILNGTVNIPMIFAVVLGLYWKRTHPTAAFLGMLLGIISVFILYFGFNKSIYASFTSLIVSVVIFIVGTLLLTNKDTDYITPLINKNNSKGDDNVA